MGILSRLESEARGLSGSAADPPPWMLELFGRGAGTSSGTVVTPDSAMRLTTVYACIRIISEGLGMLPLKMFRRRPDGQKELAIDHPLYSILHDQPNEYQNAMEWREMMTAHVLLRGNAYAHKVYRPSDGVITDLIPLHPDKIQIIRMPDGTIRYDYRPEQGEYIRYFPDEIFHLRGLSSDGIKGLSPIQLAREAVGLGMASEEYAARFFVNDGTPSGYLSHPGSLSEQAQKRMRESWEQLHSGPSGWHRTGILEEGLKYEKIGVTPREAQFLESRKYQNVEIARIYRVPLHMIQDLDRSTNNNIEQQGREFVIYCLMPWSTRWESAIQTQLLSAKARAVYFAEHNFAELLRGDIAARYEAYSVGRQWGWLSPNDINVLENRNPRTDPGGDAYLLPLNMTEIGKDGKILNAPAPQDPAPGAPTDPAAGNAGDAEDPNTRKALPPPGLDARAALAPIFLDIAERAAKKELEEVRRLFKRSKGPAIEEDLLHFFGTYRDTVERMIQPAALAYANARGLNGAASIVAGNAARELAIEYESGTQRRLRDVLGDAAAREIVLSTWIEERSRELADGISRHVEKQSIAIGGKL